MLRFIVGFLSIVALGAAVWIARLPDKVECVASGRIVDPTERHCETASGYQQLQEHALFHLSQVVLYAFVLLVVGYVIRRYYVRRVLALLSLVTTLWGGRWAPLVPTVWAMSVTLAAGLASVVWGDASLGIGLVSGGSALLAALAIAWILRVGARGLHARDAEHHG